MAGKIANTGNGIFWDGRSWRMLVGKSEIVLKYKGIDGRSVAVPQQVKKVNGNENSKSN